MAQEAVDGIAHVSFHPSGMTGNVGILYINGVIEGMISEKIYYLSSPIHRL